jgi:hypothetical protein
MRMNGLSEQYLEPEYTTAVGLVKMGAQESELKGRSPKDPPSQRTGLLVQIKRVFQKKLVLNNFLGRGIWTLQ